MLKFHHGKRNGLLTDGLFDGCSQFRVDSLRNLGLALPHVAQDGLQIHDDAAGKLQVGRKIKAVEESVIMASVLLFFICHELHTLSLN